MNKFVKNIKNGYNTETEELDSADIVQTVLLIAGFAVVVILVVGWIGTAVLNKGADVAQCIEGSSTFHKGQAGYEACVQANHSGNNGNNVGQNSYKNDKSYKDRFGTNGSPVQGG